MKSLRDTLLDLLNIESFSKNETKVVEYVVPILDKLGFIVEQDVIGNIYATRGKAEGYPMLNAHMDSVEGFSTKRYKYSTLSAKDTEKYMKAWGMRFSCDTCSSDMYCRVKYKCANCLFVSPPDCWSPSFETKAIIEEIIEEAVIESEVDNESEEAEVVVATYDDKTKRINGDSSRPIGGDDKCGIAIALSIASLTTIPMKLFFSVQEEIGLVGASYAIDNHPEFFSDVKYSITIDRKSSNHLLVTSGGTRNGSNKFIGELAKWGIIANIPITLEAGSSADVCKIRTLVKETVNVSAGYFSPHTSSEYVEMDKVIKIRNWIKMFMTLSEYK